MLKSTGAAKSMWETFHVSYRMTGCLREILENVEPCALVGGEQD